MSKTNLFNTLEIPGAFFAHAFRAKMSEPGFMRLNDYADLKISQSSKLLNHKNHSSDFIELVNNG